MQRSIRDVMAKRPPCLEATTTLDEAVGVAIREGVAELYVVTDDGRLLGIVPDYELLKARLSGADGTTEIATLMTVNPAAIDAESSFETVAVRFRECRCARLAVTSQGSVVGQIGRHDVLRLLSPSEEPRASVVEPVPALGVEAETAPRPPRFLQRTRTADGVGAPLESP